MPKHKNPIPYKRFPDDPVLDYESYRIAVRKFYKLSELAPEMVNDKKTRKKYTRKGDVCGHVEN